MQPKANCGPTGQEPGEQIPLSLCALLVPPIDQTQEEVRVQEKAAVIPWKSASASKCTEYREKDEDLKGTKRKYSACSVKSFIFCTL